jgi:hypothetical protein
MELMQVETTKSYRVQYKGETFLFVEKSENLCSTIALFRDQELKMKWLTRKYLKKCTLIFQAC